MKNNAVKTIVIAHGLVLNALTLGEKQLSAIQDAAPRARIIQIENNAEWHRQAGTIGHAVDVFFGLRPAAWFSQMPNLVWAQQVGAGANWLMESPEFRNSDVILTNASGVHAVPIAEHVLALMFALARGIHRNVRNQLARAWDRRGRILEIEGATLGVVGVGSIGEKLAEKAKSLNMNVVGLRRNPDRPSPHVDKMVGPDELAELLGVSDWVALTLAMTPETRGLIGEDELRAMKDSAFLINIARGSVVQEASLIKALSEGWIAGAGLDVFEEEPLPESSPLWGMNHVIITPHWAGATPHYIDRLIEIFVENLRRFQAGEPLVNVVDKQLGY